ncbi:slightly ste11-like protein, partial [Coemansia erecta]
MYTTADIDPNNAAPQQMPQQLTTNGYIRHGGSIPVGATPHHQQPLDMTTASLPLPVDIGGDQNTQQQQQQQQPSSHMHMQPAHQHSAIHPSNPQSPFGSSPAGNQPIFSTLNFQSSQMSEYDSYGRQPKSRANRVIKPKRTPRPPNAFILYRKAKQAEVIRDNPGVSNKDVSCIIGQMWKAEDPLIQDKFREQAEMEKKKHKEMHPNYKYQPRKPKNKRLQEPQGVGSVPGSNGSLVHGSTAAAVAAAVAASTPGQDGSFVNGSLQSALKDPTTPISGGFQPYP